MAISAAAGITWNRTLLASAWRGETIQQSQPAQGAQAQAQVALMQGAKAQAAQAAQAQPTAPAAAAVEELPMPIALAQVKELHDARQAVIVDARSADSYGQGHIAGAITLPLEAARKDLPAAVGGKVAKDATIIAYCNGFSCHDSMELGKILMKAGYASVYIYEGGFPEWRDAGYPVAKGKI